MQKQVPEREREQKQSRERC